MSSHWQSWTHVFAWRHTRRTHHVGRHRVLPIGKENEHFPLHGADHGEEGLPISTGGEEIGSHGDGHGGGLGLQGVGSQRVSISPRFSSYGRPSSFHHLLNILLMISSHRMPCPAPCIVTQAGWYNEGSKMVVWPSASKPIGNQTVPPENVRWLPHIRKFLPTSSTPMSAASMFGPPEDGMRTAQTRPAMSACCWSWCQGASDPCMPSTCRETTLHEEYDGLTGNQSRCQTLGSDLPKPAADTPDSCGPTDEYLRPRWT